MERGKFLDLVIAGPDMSGTSTQIKDLVNYFKKKNLTVRDLRGTEMDALFHAEKFNLLNSKFSSVSELPEHMRNYFLFTTYKLMSGGGTNQDLQIASCVKNGVTTYINPNSADVWILEEPTKRGAGQINRTIEQNRSKFGDEMNPIAAALAHQAYRTDEFLRFRKAFRENNKIILRSRSEESACYQIFDSQFLQNGISMEDYFNLPGHKIAFKNSPTNIFVVCGPEDWTVQNYLQLKSERSEGRTIDDHESNSEYQVLVNKRYASSWIEELYEKGCTMHGGNVPEITKFNIYDSKEQIKEKMISKLETLL
jgi:thymidylate kinase